MTVSKRRMEKSDAEIKRDVIAELEWDIRLDIEDIAVTVKNGVVTLSGTASSFLEKWAASDATLSVSGVKEVINNIIVRHPEPVRNDEDVVVDVRNALAWDQRVDVADIDVSVKNGVVTLSGEVRTLSEMDAAVNDAKWTAGVAEVINNIRVVPEEVRSDKEIIADLRNAFRRDALVDEDDIAVEVTNGVVLLSGLADNLRERSAAENDAKLTQGVVRVINNIAVAGI